MEEPQKQSLNKVSTLLDFVSILFIMEEPQKRQKTKTRQQIGQVSILFIMEEPQKRKKRSLAVEKKKKFQSFL